MCIVNLIILFVIIIVIDALYLSIIKNKYSSMIEKIQNHKLNAKLWSALIVYILIACGLYYFTKDESNINKKIINAMIFGLCSYGIYDYTNGALFTDWDMQLAFIDTVWGSILCGSSIYVYTLIKSY